MNTTAAARRAPLYTLLGALFGPPGAHLQELLRDPELCADITRSMVVLTGPDAAADTAPLLCGAIAGLDDVAALEAEYTRLFQGPGRPPAAPWESAWTGGEGGGPCVCASVEAAYQAAGMALPATGTGAAHLLAEIAHLSALAEAAEAPARRDSAQAAHDAFMAEHFGRWAPQLAAVLMREARHPLYAAAGRLLAATCGGPG